MFSFSLYKVQNWYKVVEEDFLLKTILSWSRLVYFLLLHERCQPDECKINETTIFERSPNKRL